MITCASTLALAHPAIDDGTALPFTHLRILKWTQRARTRWTFHFPFLCSFLIRSRRQVFPARCEAILPSLSTNDFSFLCFIFFSFCSRRYITCACSSLLQRSVLIVFVQRHKIKKRKKRKINSKVCCKVCRKSKYTSPSSSSLPLSLRSRTHATR